MHSAKIIRRGDFVRFALVLATVVASIAMAVASDDGSADQPGGPLTSASQPPHNQTADTR